MFYLSIVFDYDGYDRLDLMEDNRLAAIDNFLLDHKNNRDIIDYFLSNMKVSNKKGKICIIYEDLDQKRKQLRDYNDAKAEDKEKIKSKFSYAHIIPKIPNSKRLLNKDVCISLLNARLRDDNIIRRIMDNKIIKQKGKEIHLKSNKKYIFENEEEKDFLSEYNYDEKEAIERFLARLPRTNPETLYFYFRSLMDICELTISKKAVANLSVREKKIVHFFKKRDILSSTSEEDLIEDSKDMESFYTYHDLDEVIRLSPDSNRPIGSESEETKNEKNNGRK